MDFRSRGPTASRPVLAVLHQEHSTPGRIGHYLAKLGVALDVRRPRFGDPLPETLVRHAGAVIFGGPQSANDTDEFIRREIEWIAVPLAEKRPFLGICLGAQMLAKCLGARVAYHPHGKAEIGYYPIRVTEHADAVCGNWPTHVYQWHREGFELPHGAKLLAEGDIFRVQAMHYGPAAYAIQFHAEVTHAMMCRWTTRGHARMDMPGAKQRAAHFAERPMYDLAIRAWLAAFLQRWVREQTVASANSE
jgi:GMP synthase (glutamine-hydrolysing)